MKTKTVRDAYRIVYNDILNSGCSLMVGKFNATKVSKEFMYGIQFVMDNISDMVDEDGATYNDFTDIFTNNFQKSIDKMDDYLV